MMRKWIFSLALIAGCMACTDCAEPEVQPFEELRHGLLIASEGKYGEANGSLSFYDPLTGEVEQELFRRANGHYLGDTPHSITLHNGLCWVVVNNSGVIYAIDPATYLVKGLIRDLTSPRYICFISEEKAYVSELWSTRIAVVNPRTFTIEGYIETPMEGMTGSTEQMVRVGDFVYATCWSYQKSVIKIDHRTDRVVASLEVGVQPKELALDKNGKLWCLTDGGGWPENEAGYEAPKLLRINLEDFSVEQSFEMALGDFPSELKTDGEQEQLFWINNDAVWSLSIEADRLPLTPLIESDAGYLYGLTIDPEQGDLYLCDAVDFSQNGTVVRYNSDGVEIDRFTAGIAPRACCWR